MRYQFAYRRYARDFAAPVRTAHGVWTTRRGLLLRLTTAEGRVSFGEVAPIPEFGTETLEEAEDICRKLGADIGEETVDLVDERFGCVRFALSMALGGVPVAPSEKRLAVAALLPAGRGAVEVLRARLAEGFLAFKWKVGVARPEEEWPLLDELLAELPKFARLRLDANGAWDRRAAEGWLARCAERPVEFVEQPAPPEREDLLLGLADDYPVTLALDESVSRLDSARAWQGRGWRGVFVLKPALAGGWPELAAWMNTTKPDVVFSSALETALGRAQIVRAVLAGDFTRRALGFGVGGLFGAREWDGPATGPLLDATWSERVNAEDLWNAAS